jgi:hypothetical protein
MTLLAIGRCIGKSKNWNQHEPTITEIMSDSITVAMMKADGVDPVELEAQLRSIGQDDCNLAQDKFGVRRPKRSV